MAESPDRAVGINARVSGHALDVLLKLEAEQLINAVLARRGLALPPIRRALPTELPQLDLHLERLDAPYELVDGTILDLEFEVDLRVKDLRRFIRYGLGLLDVHPDKPVHTVAICGSRTKKAPPPIVIEPIGYRLTCVLLGDQDGEATLARLQKLAAAGTSWSAADRLDLTILPLMRQERGTEAMVRAGLDLAKTLPDTDRPRVMGALLALAYHYEGEAVLNRLVEELMSTNLLEEIFATQLEQRYTLGIEQGIEQGIERGRAEERRALLRRYLERQFGAIPPPLETRIAAADAETLSALLDRALASERIETL